MKKSFFHTFLELHSNLLINSNFGGIAGQLWLVKIAPVPKNIVLGS